jgi:hypothetical protein
MSRLHFVSFLVFCKTKDSHPEKSLLNSDNARWFKSDEVPTNLIANHERFHFILTKLCTYGSKYNEPMCFIEQCTVFENSFYEWL